LTVADFALVCKSYRRDVARVRRLLGTLAPCNPQQLPVIVIAPRDDLALLREALAPHRVEFASDEDVIRCQPQVQAQGLLERYRTTPGYRSQQVVKAEAWRLIGCDSYLCMDSDTVFLRPVRREDFLSSAGHPYTLLHQSRELLQLARNRGHAEVATDFYAESRRVKAFFHRSGPDYDFGPQPLLWSARVWDDLQQRFLQPRGWTLWDAIDAAPAEIRWYGEALLAYRGIPIEPIEPLFRVYHHEWQWFTQRRLGETPQTLSGEFLGAVYQSNWEFELDAAGTRSWLSRASRRLKRWRRRVQALR
jgi:hypothetical protein